MEDYIEYTLDIYGYEKRQYGWVRDNANGISQAVTIFPMNRIQMFGWNTGDTDRTDYKIYDTGHIAVLDSEFDVLIEIFEQYKNGI